MAILSSPPSTPSPSSSSIEFEPHELLGPMALRARQLSNLGEMPIVAIDYAEWKRVLPNNRFSKESDLTPEMALEQLSKRLAIKLDEATGAVADGGPPPTPVVTPGGKGRERKPARSKAVAAKRKSEDADSLPVAVPVAVEPKKMSWIEFRREHAGKGLSMAEVAERWRQYKRGDV